MSRVFTAQPDKQFWPVLIAAILLVFVCVARFPCDNIRLSFTVLLEWGVSIALAVMIWEINKYWSVFLVLALVSSIWPAYSKWSYLGYQGVFYMSVWYLFLSRIVKTDQVRYLLNGICIVALFHAVMLTLQVFDFDPLFKPVAGDKESVVGLMANRNEVSALLAICLPAFLRPRWWFFMPLILFGLFGSQSMGGLFAACVGFIFYQTMKGNILLPLASVVIAVLAYALFIDSPGWERWIMWQYGAEVGRERWLLGGGIGHWKIVMKDILMPHLYGAWCKTAHSDIFQVWFEMGAAPILLFCAYLWSAARRYRPEALMAMTAVLIVLACSMVHFLFHIATTALIAVTWLAILEVKLNRGPEETTKGDF